MKHDIRNLLGLNYIPTLGPELDDLDKIRDGERSKFGGNVKHSFSEGNAKILQECLEKFKPEIIFEIGVNNSSAYKYSSTANFVRYIKNNNTTKYFGVSYRKFCPKS